MTTDPIAVPQVDHDDLVRTAASPVARVPAMPAPELKSLLAIAVAAVVVAALYFAQDVLLPITLSIMLSFVLAPLVGLLQRTGLWRAPAVAVTMGAALGVIVLVGTVIGSQAAMLAANAPAYARTLEVKVESIQGFALKRLAAVTQTLDSRSPKRPPPLPATGGGGSSVPIEKPLLVEVAQPAMSPFAIARAILEPVLGPLETTLLVLIVSVFILMQREDLRDRFIRVFGSNDLHRTTLAMDEAGERLSRYFLSQLAVNAAFGTVVGLALWAIGIPSSAMWGLLAGMLRFVPYIGAILAAVAPMALGAAVDPGWSTALYVALLFIVLEPLVGYVVEPLLYGHSTGLSPVSVIISAIFWTWLWGPVGLILSTPLTLCLVVIGRHVRSLEFFDVLLGDRPALTPVEAFYQRILADNPDEAVVQAERLLTDRTLTDYYDDVALPVLRLASADEARGLIGRERAGEMAETMLAVFDELDERIQRSPSEAATPRGFEDRGSVLILSGRGAFDETAAIMLGHLLTRHGTTSNILRASAASRDGVGRIDLEQTSVIVICALDPAADEASLRAAIRRLKARSAGIGIVIGVWVRSTAAELETNARSVGADRAASSFLGLTETILVELEDHNRSGALVDRLMREAGGPIPVSGP